MVLEREEEIIVCMQIDEAWAHDQAMDIDHPGGSGSVAGSQQSYALSDKTNIRFFSRSAGTIYYLAVFEEEIEHHAPCLL
jgi:hypothetical protein